ncbi:SDR family oxidoreductase [Mycobacterium paraseoulense]|nr:SDR family oxidoreductase [Mycobacterium paraseoulense]
MLAPEDLDETTRLVEKAGRRIVAGQADVRDGDQLTTLIDRGVDELGRLDFFLANAGIMPSIGEPSQQLSAFRDAIDVMLTGVYQTIEAQGRSSALTAASVLNGRIWPTSPNSLG